MLSLLLAATAFVPQGPGTSAAPVVINEFSYDDSGADDFEFVELYNRSGAPIDISGWTIVDRDPTSPAYGGAGTDPTQVIAAGTILAPGAFYLLANTAMLPGGAVPGASQILPPDSFENGPSEALELHDATGAIVDSVAYELGGVGVFGTAPNGPHPLEGNGFYGDLSVGNGIGMPSASVARHLDGWDNDDNGHDFGFTCQPTPGTSNVFPNVLPYTNNFDGGIDGTPIPGWATGFVPPHYVDPTLVGAWNLTAKPASPQGGLAMVTWDSSGGGNAVQFVTAPVSDVVVDTYAWMEPTMAPFNPALYSPTLPGVLLDTYNYADGEAWVLGVRGSCQANANPPDLGGYFAAVAPGVGTRYHTLTGIAWVHLRTVSFSRLFLVDFGNGPDPATGTNYTVLAGPIDIVAGVNDGWQRLRLHVQGNKVVANFGGTPGCGDGATFQASGIYDAPGAVYIGYREALLYNSNGLAGCHPPLFDALDIHAPTTTLTFVGTGSPTSVGIPGIDARGLAVVGNLNFAILGSGLVPFGAPGYAFCGVAIGFGTVPGGFPIPGAPPTALGYISPIGGSAIGFADAGGNVAFNLPIPCFAPYLGITLSSQVVDFDTTLPFAAPIGLSRAMQTTVGN